MERAIVIPRPQRDSDPAAILGAATGSYLSGILTDGMTVGLGWGRTLSSSLASLPQRQFSRFTVVSLLGGLTRASVSNPSEFAWRFADRLGAECFMMAAPVYAPDALTREALINHSGMEDVFSHAGRLDVALISVGDLSPNSTLVRFNLLTTEEIASLARAGSVGDVLCRFIDAEGRLLDHPLNDRVISAKPEMLRKSRRIVLSSGGWEKTAVILAAIRMLAPEVLITDEVVAAALVEKAR